MLPGSWTVCFGVSMGRVRWVGKPSQRPVCKPSPRSLGYRQLLAVRIFKKSDKIIAIVL